VMEEADAILLLALRNSGCTVPEEVRAHYPRRGQAWLGFPDDARRVWGAADAPQLSTAGEERGRHRARAVGGVLRRAVVSCHPGGARAGAPSRSASRLTAVHPPRWMMAAAAPHPPLFRPTHPVSTHLAPPAERSATAPTSGALAPTQSASSSGCCSQGGPSADTASLRSSVSTWGQQQLPASLHAADNGERPSVRHAVSAPPSKS
jgi:hypothetical protein